MGRIVDYPCSRDDACGRKISKEIVMRALIACVFLCFGAVPAAAVAIAPACPRPASAVTHRPPSPQLLAARQVERQACAADRAAFCAGVPPGCGRPMQCLRAHAGELSSGCMNAITQLRAAARAEPR
jgi:hypothetical protein